MMMGELKVDPEHKKTAAPDQSRSACFFVLAIHA